MQSLKIFFLSPCWPSDTSNASSDGHKGAQLLEFTCLLATGLERLTCIRGLFASILFADGSHVLCHFCSKLAGTVFWSSAIQIVQVEGDA